MNNIFILLTMIFCHVIADFNLQVQGWLHVYKDKQFWDGNGGLYQNDWIAALAIHSFAWTFLMMLPAAIWLKASWVFFLLFALNVVIHAVVDHMKANEKKINLITDQAIHIAQIITTLWILVGVQ